jgi:hypothetical protein
MKKKLGIGRNPHSGSHSHIGVGDYASDRF